MDCVLLERAGRLSNLQALVVLFFILELCVRERESWCRFLLHTGVRGQSWCRVESRAERLFLLLSDPVESCVMSEKC